MSMEEPQTGPVSIYFGTFQCPCCTPWRKHIHIWQKPCQAAKSRPSRTQKQVSHHKTEPAEAVQLNKLLTSGGTEEVPKSRQRGKQNIAAKQIKLLPWHLNVVCSPLVTGKTTGWKNGRHRFCCIFLCVAFSNWCLVSVTGKNIKCEKGRLLKSCQPQLHGKFPHTHSSRRCAHAVKILVCHKAWWFPARFHFTLRYSTRQICVSGHKFCSVLQWALTEMNNTKVWK